MSHPVISTTPQLDEAVRASLREIQFPIYQNAVRGGAPVEVLEILEAQLGIHTADVAVSA